MYMREKRIVLIEDRLNISVPEEIFCGYIDMGEESYRGTNLKASAGHRQYNRIYSSLGIHPTLISSETQGRYYVYEGIFDDSKGG